MVQQHTVRAFDEELSRLKALLGQMGGLAEEQLERSMDALDRRDIVLADRVIADDEKIDVLERTIEDFAVTIIAKRQPMAGDLRQVMVAVRIASDLERIGDLAKNVAKRTHAMVSSQPRQAMVGLKRMTLLAQQQLQNVLDSFVNGDVQEALTVWKSDDEIDSLYNSLFRELLTYMMEDPRMITLCTHLLFAAKNLERIGDHATNIAENIYYLVHGHPIAGARPKGEAPF